MKKLIITLFVILTVCTAIPAGAQNKTGLAWTNCNAHWQCADVSVPADWRQPDGAKVSIGLGKVPAKDQQHKAGTLLVNFGGPAENIPFIDIFGNAVQELAQHWDVVVFDPRAALAKARSGEATDFYKLITTTTTPSLFYPTWCADYPLIGGYDDVIKTENTLRTNEPRIGWLGADTPHAVYLSGSGNRCVRDYANKYLLTGQLPPPNTICPAES